MIRRRGLAAASVALVLTACAPTVVWRGRSPDRSTAARVVEDGGRQRVVVGEVAEPAFDAVGVTELQWTARRLAYPARTGGRWRVVIGGVAGPPHDAIGEVHTDGVHVVYEARDPTGWRVVVDGVAGPSFDSVRRGSLAFLPDGRVLYVAHDARGEHAVVGGVVGPGFAQVERVTVGAKGTMAAYAGWDATRARVVVDGRVAGVYDEVLAVEVAAFEPHWAAVVTEGGVPMIVRDGVVVARQPGAMELRISGDGAHLAWTMRVAGREELHVDGRVLGTYDAVEDVELVPRTNALVCVVRDGAAQRVLHDATADARVAEVEDLVTSPSGHWGYVARRGAGRLVVIDGVLRFRGEWAGALTLADEGPRWAFVTRHAARRFVVTPDGTTEIPRPFVDTLVVDATATHWALAVADTATGRLEVLVDGRAVAPLDVDEVAGDVALGRDPVGAVHGIVAGELARAIH